MYVLHEYYMAWSGLTHFDLFWLNEIPVAPYGTCKKITRREAEKLFSRWYADLVREKQYKPIWA